MPKQLSRLEFIKRAHKKHYGKFDYTKSKYINYETKVIIICKLHGEFLQTPHDHLTGYGCPVCGKSQKLTTSTFIDKATTKHKGLYNYGKTKYINSKTKIIITCPTHGDFEQLPASHLYGRGCPSCTKVSTYNAFVEKASYVHKNKYTYVKPIAYAFDALMEVVCPIHGTFYQKASYHLSGRGCASCAKSGFDATKPGVLYYLKVLSHNVYKIGITNYSVEKRFSAKDLSNIEIIRTWYYVDGKECQKAEKLILDTFKSSKYTGDNILISGNTEMFIEDVLQLDVLPASVFSK